MDEDVAPVPSAPAPAPAVEPAPAPAPADETPAIREWCEAKGLRLGPGELPDHGYVEAYHADKAYREAIAQ